jgi:hypothetical protein
MAGYPGDRSSEEWSLGSEYVVEPSSSAYNFTSIIDAARQWRGRTPPSIRAVASLRKRFTKGSSPLMVAGPRVIRRLLELGSILHPSAGSPHT